MHAILKSALTACAVMIAGHAGATITLYEHNDFQGKGVTLLDGAGDFRDFGFNDRASSVVVTGEPWEVCKDVRFEGRCLVLVPGRYRALSELDVNDRISSARPVHGRDRRGDQPPGQVVFYEHAGFEGRAFAATSDLNNFAQFGFNDQASSVVVYHGRWEACEHANYEGRCVVLRPGRYPDLNAMGLNDRLSSLRALHRDAPVDERRYAPEPAPVHDWRRRPAERLYEVSVDSVRAVYASAMQPQQPAQRCWMEQQPATSTRGEASVPGAVIGGVIGGILGHQVGGGTGRDVATAGGVLAGAVIGANVGRESQAVPAREVQRCTAVPVAQQRPDYWDVAYRFRGVQHHVQTANPPGPTLMVNDEGEPRV